MKLRYPLPYGWSRIAQWGSRLRRTTAENAWLKLLALLLAVILFALSRQPPTDVRLAGVPLEFRGLKSGLEIGSELEPTVSVRLRGPRDVVRSVTPNQIAVIADLTSKEPGERVVQLRSADVTRPEGVEVLRVDPASVTLQLELTSRKAIEVKPQFRGELAQGLELYTVQATPPTVEVEGPQSAVERLTSISTESVPLDNKTASFHTAVDVEPPNHFVRVVTIGSVVLSVELGPRRTTH
jgi:hypothetical protein